MTTGRLARGIGTGRCTWLPRRRLGERCGDAAAEVAGGGQFVAVAEYRPEARRYRALAPRRADEALWHPVPLEPVQQLARVPLVGVAVT